MMAYVFLRDRKNRDLFLHSCPYVAAGADVVRFVVTVMQKGRHRFETGAGMGRGCTCSRRVGNSRKIIVGASKVCRHKSKHGTQMRQWNVGEGGAHSSRVDGFELNSTHMRRGRLEDVNDKDTIENNKVSLCSGPICACARHGGLGVGGGWGAHRSYTADTMQHNTMSNSTHFKDRCMV